MGKVFTKKWFEATLIRMIRTGAEAALAVIGSTTMFGGVDWRVVGSSTLLAMIVSFLLALKGLPEVIEEEL
jgi:hypothetical protein